MHKGGRVDIEREHASSTYIKIAQSSLYSAISEKYDASANFKRVDHENDRRNEISVSFLIRWNRCPAIICEDPRDTLTGYPQDIQTSRDLLATDSSKTAAFFTNLKENGNGFC